ncbi:MAG: GNAT family N-acetyltransferase [Clostridia bacterium]|nr:GNAT family N-acetyltransferase [Clostridia bacterium]
MQIWLNVNRTAHDFIPQQYWTGNFDEVRKAMVHAEVYTYENDGTICGFIGLIDSYIAGIFVEEAQQLQGIGTRLLEHVKETHTSLSLHVYKRNRKAVNFYLKKSFCVVAEDMDEMTGEPELEMRWNTDEGSGCERKNAAGMI